MYSRMTVGDFVSMPLELEIHLMNVLCRGKRFVIQISSVLPCFFKFSDDVTFSRMNEKSVQSYQYAPLEAVWSGFTLSLLIHNNSPNLSIRILRYANSHTFPTDIKYRIIPLQNVQTSRKHAYIILTSLNPTLYSKPGVYRGIQRGASYKYS